MLIKISEYRERHPARVHVHATKLGAAMQRRENLTWIEQPLVVERAFKSLLLIEVGLGEHRRHQVALT